METQPNVGNLPLCHALPTRGCRWGQKGRVKGRTLGQDLTLFSLIKGKEWSWVQQTLPQSLFALQNE